ncbi:MAG: DUF1579 domain-containing protein [Candidatus Omnitrophica bacterium]|nr:DUF1579 domain-containing protein [Candidatus Omnitrophota bacterium]
MRRIIEGVVSGFLILGVGLAQGEEVKTAQVPVPTMEEAMRVAMEKGSPGEAHKALEPLVGNWSYTATMWMAPEAEPKTMSGTAAHSLIFGGRFLKQETHGAMEGFPPFEGLGFTGYDNMRKEYQTVWIDSMNTALITATGQYDAAAKKLTQSGDFSCPVTGETHHKFRDTWTIVDENQATYESYSWTPDGKEYKGMEIQYTRTQ